MNHACNILSLLFLSGSRQFSFTSWKLCWMYSGPEGPPPSLSLWIRFPLNLLFPSEALAENIKFLGALFLLNCTFYIHFCLMCSFFFYYKVVTSNHATELTLCCLKISYTKEMGPLLFNLAPGMFLEHKQKATIFFAKISQ